KRFTTTVGILPVIAFAVSIAVLIPHGNMSPRPYHPVDIALSFGPGALAMMEVVLSGFMVSWLRTKEQRHSHTQWTILTYFARSLTKDLIDITGSLPEVTERRQNDRPIDRTIASCLRKLCDSQDGFAYNAAVAWYFERHQDRGDVAVPVASANVNVR